MAGFWPYLPPRLCRRLASRPHQFRIVDALKLLKSSAFNFSIVEHAVETLYIVQLGYLI